MCYIEDCEDHYQPPVDPTPECPYEDCEGGSGNTGSESGNTGGSDGKNPSGNCCCDDRTDTGGTKPGGGTNPAVEPPPPEAVTSAFVIAMTAPMAFAA